MECLYSVEIFDQTKTNKIGELMTATPNEILQYIGKNLIVIDKKTGMIITEDSVLSMIGISDGVITV